MLKKLNELRCRHRHNIEEHPNCFALGEIDEKQLDKIAKGKGLQWFQMVQYKMGYLDIETTGLDADFSTILTWSIKEKDGKVVFDCITKKELFDNGNEKRILESLLKEMKKYKILVGYYSGSMHFDIPYIRTKMLRYNLDFPEYGSIYHFDLYNVVKSRLKLSRSSLDNVCNYLGINGKTKFDKDWWRKAHWGDPEALKYVLLHNIGDVEITEKLHNRLVTFRRWTKTSI